MTFHFTSSSRLVGYELIYLSNANSEDNDTNALPVILNTHTVCTSLHEWQAASTSCTFAQSAQQMASYMYAASSRLPPPSLRALTTPGRQRPYVETRGAGAVVPQTPDGHDGRVGILSLLPLQATTLSLSLATGTAALFLLLLNIMLVYQTPQKEPVLLRRPYVILRHRKAADGSPNHDRPPLSQHRSLLRHLRRASLPRVSPRRRAPPTSLRPGTSTVDRHAAAPVTPPPFPPNPTQPSTRLHHPPATNTALHILQRLGPKPIPQQNPHNLLLPPRHPPHLAPRLPLLPPLLHPLHPLRRLPPAPPHPARNPARPDPARQHPPPARRG